MVLGADDAVIGGTFLWHVEVHGLTSVILHVESVPASTATSASPLKYYVGTFFFSFTAFILKSILFDISIATSAFFHVHLLEYFFPSLHFQSV